MTFERELHKRFEYLRNNLLNNLQAKFDLHFSTTFSSKTISFSDFTKKKTLT
jgi:hypothetical protein